MSIQARLWIIACLVVLASPVVASVVIGLARHSTEIEAAAREAFP
ncbi:MAG TPA: hypothetical protein PLH23_04940 [Hyphomonadaceae bacterium]|nr:hypothetical protein [Hyphomonadaceae bacterium]HPI47592.1 hypothetical protein [Hyphomonadaceae bacterium]